MSSKDKGAGPGGWQGKWEAGVWQ